MPGLDRCSIRCSVSFIEHLSNVCGTTADRLSKLDVPWFVVSCAGRGRVRLTGELDMAGVPLLRAALADTKNDIVVDCSGLTFIDCAGLNGLVTAQQACEADGARLALMAPPPCLMRLLELVGLEGRLAIRDGSEP